MQDAEKSTPAPDDQVSRGFKLSTRALGTIGGIVSIILGIFRLLTFTPLCLVAAILQLMIGFTVIALEAPCCCQFVDCFVRMGKFSEARPYWLKGTLYILISILPILLCFCLTTVLSSVLVFGTGVLYGMMALRKKRASQAEKTDEGQRFQ